MENFIDEILDYTLPKLRAEYGGFTFPRSFIADQLARILERYKAKLVASGINPALYGVPADKLRRCIIAYEPIWAIGTGKTATAEEAQEVCEGIRTVIRKLYGARVARAVTIQYGGSMNAKNAAELLAQPDIDGGLIGGASLKPDQFMQIINAANQD